MFNIIFGLFLLKYICDYAILNYKYYFLDS